MADIDTLTARLVGELHREISKKETELSHLKEKLRVLSTGRPAPSNGKKPKIILNRGATAWMRDVFIPQMGTTLLSTDEIFELAKDSGHPKENLSSAIHNCCRADLLEKVFQGDGTFKYRATGKEWKGRVISASVDRSPIAIPFRGESDKSREIHAYLMHLPLGAQVSTQDFVEHTSINYKNIGQYLKKFVRLGALKAEFVAGRKVYTLLRPMK